MNKNDADEGNCPENKFIHLWKSLNTCPHISQVFTIYFNKFNLFRLISKLMYLMN